MLNCLETQISLDDCALLNRQGLRAGNIYGDGSGPSARALAISGCCRWCRQATTTEPSTFTRYQTPYLNWRRLPFERLR